MSPEPGPAAPPAGSISTGSGVAALLDGLGLSPRRVTFVAKASTSEVWRAETAAGTVAVRVLAPRPGKPGDLDADIALRRRLAALGMAVAEPLHHHRERPDLAVAAHRPAWCVDRWIDGDPADTETADTVWHDLGRLLAALHALPVRGHGRLTASGEGLRGRRDRPGSGVADRFDDPWPFAGPALPGHPLAGAAPDLVPRLARLEGAIRAAADRPPVIAHVDLNGANVRHAGDRLRGVIDFADATAMAAAWDFASLRHFHGPAAVSRTLAGYTNDPAVARGLEHDARLLAPVIALHHLSRARTLGLPRRRTYAIGRLRRDLDEIGPG